MVPFEFRVLWGLAESTAVRPFVPAGDLRRYFPPSSYVTPQAITASLVSLEERRLVQRRGEKPAQWGLTERGREIADA